MRRIAVLTSGGDASGMNAAVRAVVHTAHERGWEVVGVRHGYRGLLAAEFAKLGSRDVAGVIGRGGTMLGTARCPEFATEDGSRRAIDALRDRGVGALVVVGGNGSQAGARSLHERGFPVVGIASTIDNDLAGVDVTIGVDTALNVALEAIDRIKVTAAAHERAFLVETMGREHGYLALMAGIAGGAEAIVIPEREMNPEEVADRLKAAYASGKGHAIVVVAEGAKNHGDALAAHFAAHRERIGFELRVTKLGHVQRGGAPGAFDRILATRAGAAAVERLAGGDSGVLLGLRGGVIASVPLVEAVASPPPLDLRLLELAGVLAR